MWPNLISSAHVSSHVAKEPPRSSEPETLKPLGASKSYPDPSQSWREPEPGVKGPNGTAPSTVTPRNTSSQPAWRPSTITRSAFPSPSADRARASLHPSTFANLWHEVLNPL